MQKLSIERSFQR